MQILRKYITQTQITQSLRKYITQIILRNSRKFHYADYANTFFITHHYAMGIGQLADGLGNSCRLKAVGPWKGPGSDPVTATVTVRPGRFQS